MEPNPNHNRINASIPQEVIPKKDLAGHIMSFVTGALIGGVLALCWVIDYNGPLSGWFCSAIVGGAGVIVGLISDLLYALGTVNLPPDAGDAAVSVFELFTGSFFD